MVRFGRRLVLISASVLAAGLLGGAAFWCLWSDELDTVRAAGRRISPLHKPLDKPQPGDWLTVHAEPGQTFEQYRLDDLNHPDRRPGNLYVRPLGQFNHLQKRLVRDTAQFLGCFYGLPIQRLPPLGLDVIPPQARRVHPHGGQQQILSTYVLKRLREKRPPDAFAVLALTTSDLWPGKNRNFVFGQASLGARVGVWSIYRNGNPARDYRLCLLRSLKTATHETGHMLGFWHCTAFECLMNGSNGLAESDRKPLAFCPECEQKVWWICGLEPGQRYRQLIQFAEAHRLTKEARFWKDSLAAVE